jgi:ABC-type uncharacterized transport system permease subunit
VAATNLPERLEAVQMGLGMVVWGMASVFLGNALVVLVALVTPRFFALRARI